MRSWKFAWLVRNGGTNHFKTMAKSAPWLRPFYLILYWFCFIIKNTPIPSHEILVEDRFPVVTCRVSFWHLCCLVPCLCCGMLWLCQIRIMLPLTFDVPATLRPLGVCSSLPMAHVGRSKANCEYRSNLTRKRLLLKRASSFTWVCLKMGYTPNYSHLVGIIISKTLGCRGTLFSDKPTSLQFQQAVFFLRRNRRGRCHTAGLKNGQFLSFA